VWAGDVAVGSSAAIAQADAAIAAVTSKRASRRDASLLTIVCAITAS
jgi:hypothetical protein